MDVPGGISLRKSRFTEFLVRLNAMDAQQFMAWIFCPGMLFNAKDKWWGDRGRRSKPHEGVDLCLYRNGRGRIHRLDEKTAVPALYQGSIVKIFDDFLGQSIIMEHRFPNGDPFCSIYGHIKPHRSIHAGSDINEGDIVATINGPGISKTGILPHIHLSIGLLSRDMSADRLDWDRIVDPDVMTLVDPLAVLDGKYAVHAPHTCMI